MVTGERDKKKRKDLFLERFYKVPNPFNTLEEWEKFTHQDLEEMNRSELLAEQARLKARLLLDPNPSDWLIERLKELGGKTL